MGLTTAFKAFFSILGNGEKADLWEKVCEGKLIEDSQLKDLESEVEKLEASLSTGENELTKVKEELKIASSKNDRSDAIYTLTLLQREGRLIDFLKEDIGPYSDEQVGAAVRQIHEGCGKVLEKYFKVESLVDSAEGDEVEVPKAYDPAKYSLSGQVSGEGPFKGSLVHKGWLASKLTLPERTKDTDTSVICPSEVDI
ncbi:DUF2760 domain-containing protein [Lentisphaera profundi]|uniref:DUF2760 domain-containing protein n=1 Tax=Lentisphaera profundi TaxID=1658616 RepID=A0ABY7VX50_9BACT|nr:DUF2760 domain-containing protein [Lentisphaera profundi]WDE98359.1 DUF2760 domain-containing protein [Lentisphaera profundi]